MTAAAHTLNEIADVRFDDQRMYVLLQARIPLYAKLKVCSEIANSSKNILF